MRKIILTVLVLLYFILPASVFGQARTITGTVVNVRRYDYNPAIFRGMALPANVNPAMNGHFLRRSGFPQDLRWERR